MGVLGYLLSRDDDSRGPPSSNDTEGTPILTRTPEPTDSEPRDEEDFADREDVVDVRDYGAVGDGLTDDSGAITRAIRAAAPGETVFLPETADSYLLSYDGTGEETAIELGTETDLRDVTVLGETPAAGAQTLRVEPGSYDASAPNWVLKLVAAQRFRGLTFRNLTIDGARPRGDDAAALAADTDGRVIGRVESGEGVSIRGLEL